MGVQDQDSKRDKEGRSDYIGFRVGSHVSSRLREISSAEERSVAYLVRLFVTEGLRTYDERRGGHQLKRP